MTLMTCETERLESVLDRLFFEKKPFPRHEIHPRISVIKMEDVDGMPFENLESIMSYTCLDILNEDLNNTKPQFYAITRGMGCGKSRFIEEMRLWYDRNVPEMLFSTITFNSNFTALSTSEWNDKEVSLAFEVIARMIASYYGKNLKRVSRQLNKEFNFSNFQEEDKFYFISDLFQDTINHLVKKHEASFNTTITHFALAVDETADSINQLKPPPGMDLYSKIRGAILDQAIRPNLKCHLIVSSLNYAIFESTPTLRTIPPLFCGQIDSDFVVNSIWKKTFEKYYPAGSFVYDQMAPRLLILAESIVDIVRLVQFTNQKIDLYLKSTNGTFTLSHYTNFTKFIFHNLKEEVNKHYELTTDATQLYPVLFSQEIAMDDADIDPPECVMNSVYTNAISRFPLASDKRKSLRFQPQGSLFRLALTNHLFDKIFIWLDQLITDPKKTERKGLSLEDISFVWYELLMKDLVMTKSKFNPRFTIGNFFGIDTDILPDELGDLRDDLYIPNDLNCTRITIPPFKKRLRDNSTQFLEQLRPYCDPRFAFRMIRSAPLDAFDNFIVFRNLEKKDDKPFIVFLEAKSAEITKERKAGLRDLDHYNYLMEVLKEVPDNFQGDIFDSLRNKRFVFLYLTDYQFVEGFEQVVSPNCYIISESELKRSFSILFNVFKAARAGSTSW
jgi:hypothetical protein